MKKVIIIMCTITYLFSASIIYLANNRKALPTGNPLIDTTPRATDQLHINSEGKLNINTATAEELMLLNGIGEVLAQRIVEYREAHGPYKELSELLNIEGIGTAKLENIIKQIYIA